MHAFECIVVHIYIYICSTVVIDVNCLYACLSIYLHMASYGYKAIL